MRLSKIRISPEFLAHNPRKYKMQAAKLFYETHGYIDSPIVVNKHNVLIDGYIRYLLLMEAEVKRYAVIKVKE